jgi:lipopolysaccharide biosynthesis protein
MRWRLRRGNAGHRVLDVQSDAVRVEGGPDGRAGPETDKVAVIAHWSADATVSRSVATLVSNLEESGFGVIVVSSAPTELSLVWPGASPAGVTVVRRPNVGYDFGSWSTALDRFPRIRDARRVLLMNDSLAGPFAPIDGLLDRFSASAADVWALTDTMQFGYHLQSYCLGFTNGCLRERPLEEFWHDIRVEPSRDDVIWHGEIQLSRILSRERFIMEAAFPHQRIVPEGKNPTIIGWRRLLELGFPFVKRQLLREPDLVPDGTSIPLKVRELYGIEVAAWT